MRARRLVSLASAVLLLISACSPQDMVRRAFPPSFPHDEYAESLRKAGLDRTALGRDWLVAADRAVRTPLRIALPLRETGYLAPEEPSSVGYRFDLRRGQRLQVDVALESSEPGRLFIDLFREPSEGATPERLTSAPEGTRQLEFEAGHDGSYVLRIQPELLRGGRYTLTQQALASLRFPVAGKDSRSVGSGFGAARDGGRREHHGIDIFAPRGTPVVAAADGIVSSVGETDIGGKVVWLWDPTRGLALYYAHLDTQNVTTGASVRAGDALGAVGNTGNARTTSPHLHFGIYRRGEGPIDPLPFVREPSAAPPPIIADTSSLPSWRRIDPKSIALSASPADRAPTVMELPRHSVVRVEAATARWYRVRVPDDRAGFVPASATRAIDSPLRSERRATPSPIRDRPMATAATLAYVEADRPVPVLGSFAEYLLVRAPGDKLGWLARADARAE
jgi:murein DD-endopeptidase MepM/ murein hydrolase activator NlpD